MSWCDPDLVLDLAVVTLTIKSCPGYILETVRSRKLILDTWQGHWLGVVGMQRHNVTLI